MAALKGGRVEIHFDQVLGEGAYGVVCRAKCGLLPCAAKALHSALFSYQDPGESTILRKFDEECQFLSSIKHPNIIQYLGTAVDSETGRHVLLMELMDESLTKLLDQSKKGNCPPSYQLQISVCCDVSLALTYLHSNDIIHRDLSSNNVLLLAGRRAKVADFGVSTIFDSSINRLTVCPGSKVYMPPEAQIEPPDYTNKLDCFSLGVLIIQMATLRYPDPTPLYRLVPNVDYPSGIIQVFVPETKRRENDISLVAKDHPLLPMALDCLEVDRPSAQALCEELLEMRGREEGKSELEVAGGGTNDLSKEKGEGEQDKSDQSMLVDSLLLALEEKTKLLQDYERDFAAVHSRELAAAEGAASGPIPKQAAVSGEYLSSNSREVAGISYEGIDEGSDIASSNISLSGTMCEEVKNVHTTAWVYEPAPESFSAYDGSCVFDSDRAYFLKKFILYCYQYSSSHEPGGWSQLVSVPLKYCGLALIDKKVTTVSGWNGYILSYSLHTLHDGSHWKQDLPAIGTAREHPACVSTHSHLIVLGGVINVLTAITCSVEILDLRNRQWSTATSIPKIQTPRAICCGETLYLSSYASDAFYSCRIQDLLQSTEDSNNLSGSLWTKLQRLPTHSKASVTAFDRYLVAVGGRSEEKKDARLIYCYNREANWWREIGEMPTARGLVLVGVLPDARIMCVGGTSEASNDLRVVEIGQVKELGCDMESESVPAGRASSCTIM
jgi:serine/threonine protein kinase